MRGQLHTFYLERTHRDENSFLFIGTRAPCALVGALKDDLADVIKRILKVSGINTKIFKAYTTRHGATLAVFKKGVSLDVIKNPAGLSATS